MPAAVLTPEAWAEVRRASEAGVDDETLSASYGVSREAIRKARQRGKWMTPERLLAQAEQQRLAERHKHIATGSVSRMSQSPIQAMEIAGKSLAEMGESHPLRLARYLSDKIQRAVEADALPEVENWKNLATADGMLRKALGLDRPQQNIQVNLWGSGTSTSFTGQNVESLFREAE